jgi:ankyrin repeat protein
MNIDPEDRLAVEVIEAIHGGDLEALVRLLAENPYLATARIVDARRVSRTLLHIVTDWPGHFPNGARTVGALIAAGAEVNAPVISPGAEKPSETALHWAASSDDVAVLDALLDGGADVEAPGACIAGGTPLDDAVAFGQWHAARRLVERGARTALWHSAALGLMERVKEYFAGSATPARYPWGKGSPESLDEVTIAFWCACHGGQEDAAKYLLDRGAKLNWISDWDQLTSLDAAQRAGASALVEWLRCQGAKSAKGSRG